MVQCHNVSFKTPFKVDAEIDYMLCTKNLMPYCLPTVLPWQLRS